MTDDLPFTGERLHEGSERHQAAYDLARRRAGGGRVLDLGSGSGYGTASIARGGARVTGVDRVAPDPAQRGPADFVRADLRASPFRPGSFDLVVSFQVIEHLEDPSAYLDALARALRAEGVALVTTPNVLTSDGVNPYHVHEYRAEELGELLRTRFEEVEVQGIGTSDRVRRHLAERSARVRRIMRLDPLNLRELLPRAWIEWLFARFALLVRRRAGAEAALADVGPDDFPVGPASRDCLDLLAVCRRPRA
jgi:2-polyprenyl-3-methyl-5-hydroxy-6-metoxy-1,4-benzoquinol methylase